jgi:multidrug transporter EmrE-like cation transporter
MLAAGFMMGLAAYGLKAGLAGKAVDSYFILSVLTDPFMWMVGILSILAFLLMQRALHGSHVSIVSPMIGGIAIVLPVLMAYFWLGEAVSIIKWAGILLVLLGTAGLGK